MAAPEVLSFPDWQKGPGSAINPVLAMKAYQDYINSAVSAQQAAQTQAINDLNSNYGTAQTALQGAEKADIAQYQQQSPLLQRKLIGSLNARGLGTSMNTITGYTNGAKGPGQVPGSVPIYGAGNAQYQNLLNSQAQGLNSIQGGYQDLSNSLERQKTNDNIDLNAFYTNLAQQRAYVRNLQQQNQAGVGDIFGAALSAASLFV